MVKLNWTDFKSFVAARNIPIQDSTLPDGSYLLEAHDVSVMRNCLLQTGTADHTDYVDNYQADANTSLTDSNGIALSRTKVTKTGWHFQVHGIEFLTSKLASIYNKDETETDLGFTTIKYYNSSEVELVAGTQAELDTNCVKTVFDWEPTFDFEIVGGVFEQPSPPVTDTRMWVIAIPDLTVAQGGSVPFTQGGINLRYISGHLRIDGKTAKAMSYDATYHTNKFRIIIRHATGGQCPINLLFSIYRLNA